MTILRQIDSSAAYLNAPNYKNQYPKSAAVNGSEVSKCPIRESIGCLCTVKFMDLTSGNDCVKVKTIRGFLQLKARILSSCCQAAGQI